jgi:4-hydroxybenzoate polyprenyltransferase
MRPAAIAYLQLIRLPNLFTAAADSLAGWLLVGGPLGDLARWVPLGLASMSLYAAGMALNDVVDLEVDRRERPGRPLPSGRVSVRVARFLAAAGLIAGPILAALSGSPASGGVAAILALCILGYDLGLKKTILGPELMGACRALNLLLGMSQAPALGGPVAWTAAVAYGLFVAGITWISRSETETGRTGGLLGGLTLQNLAILALAWAALGHRRFPLADPERPLIPAEGLLVLAIVALIVNLSASGALREPTPARFQATVKTGIFSLIWLNVGVVAAVRGPLPALAIAAFWVPAFLLGRWLYST